MLKIIGLTGSGFLNRYCITIKNGGKRQAGYGMKVLSEYQQKGKRGIG